jgi:hypothetical protein
MAIGPQFNRKDEPKNKNAKILFDRPVSDGAKAITATAERAEEVSGKLSSFLDFQSKTNDGTPFWSSGARSLIKIGGKPVGVCQNISWQVAYVGTPIHTIDSAHAWDIDVGQVNINASLSRIIDPIRGPESDSLFAIMQSAIHQPLVELQVLDALGTCLFFARGMFISVNGNIAIGQLGQMSAQFTGIAYQHYVSQEFQPYGTADKLGNVLNKGQAIVKKFSGGLL